jgi:hypothetical protein
MKPMQIESYMQNVPKLSKKRKQFFVEVVSTPLELMLNNFRYHTEKIRGVANKIGKQWVTMSVQS